MALTKNDIIQTVIERVGFSSRQSSDIVEQLIEIIKKTLENDDKIMISGFGKFSVKKKKERLGRNPATGDSLMLEKRKVVTFQHSIVLKDKINN